MSSGLSNLDLYDMKNLAREDLQIKFGESYPKILVVDNALLRPLDTLFGNSFLRETAKVKRLYTLDSMEDKLYDQQHVTYMVRPTYAKMRKIMNHVQDLISKGQKHSYTVLCVPRKLHICLNILEEGGLYDVIRLDDFPIDCVPLDSDLVSLEISDSFSSLYLEKDTKYLYDVACSLYTFHCCYGKTPNFYVVGKNAQATYELFTSLLETKGDITAHSREEISHVILIDRNVDMISPLLTSQIYPALAAEIFDIRCSQIEIQQQVAKFDKTDPFYQSKFRDAVYQKAQSILKELLNELKDKSDESKTLKNVADMKSFVSNELKGAIDKKSSVAKHLKICETIKSEKFDPIQNNVEFIQAMERNMLLGIDSKESATFVEEQIVQQLDPSHALRLLTLYNLTQDGISRTKMEDFFRCFLQAYGFQKLTWLHNCKKTSLLADSDQTIQNRPTFKTLAGKKLSLVNKSGSVETRNIDDFLTPNYVYGGYYTPLIAHLVEKLIINKPAESKPLFEDYSKMLNVPVKHYYRGESARGRKTYSAKSILVYFIGGCTRAELSALRTFGRASTWNYRIIFATTEMLNSVSIINSLK